MLSYVSVSDDQSERDADIFRGEVSLQRYTKVLYFNLISFKISFVLYLFYEALALCTCIQG